MNDSLVSVIIPTYKRPDKLKRAIDSVLNQTYKNIEIIIVDDNDKDSKYRIETEKFIEKYSNNRVKYVKHEENKGAPIARNTGINKANGEYIAFLDDDDEFLPSKLEKQVNKFKTSKFKNLGLVYCKVKFLDGKGDLLRYSTVDVRGNALKFHLVKTICSSSAMLIESSVLKEINGFRNLICGQDNDLILRILLKGYKVDYVDDVSLIMYFHEEDRISTNEKRIEGLKTLYEIKKKYFNILNKKQIKKVKQRHFLQLFRIYFYRNDAKEAREYLIKAIKINPFSLRSFVEGLGLFINYSKIIKLKKLLHIIKNKLS